MAAASGAVVGGVGAVLASKGSERVTVLAPAHISIGKTSEKMSRNCESERATMSYE